MRIRGAYVRDKWGWPIETVKGQRVRNAIRLLLWVDLRKTWALRAEAEAIPKLTPASAWRSPGSPQTFDSLPNNGQPAGLHHFGDTQ